MNECGGMILSRFFKCHQLHKTMKIIIGGLHRTSCKTFDFQVSQLKNPPRRMSPWEILPGGDCTAARPSRQDLPNPDHGQDHMILTSKSSKSRDFDRDQDCPWSELTIYTSFSYELLKEKGARSAENVSIHTSFSYELLKKKGARNAENL